MPRAAAVVAPANRAAGRSRKRRASHDGRLLHQHQRKRARLEDTPDGSLGTFFDELSAVNPALASEVDSALGKYGLEAKSKWELSERNKRDRQDRLDNVRLDDRLEREKARWVAAMDGAVSKMGKDDAPIIAELQGILEEDFSTLASIHGVLGQAAEESGSKLLRDVALAMEGVMQNRLARAVGAAAVAGLRRVANNARGKARQEAGKHYRNLCKEYARPRVEVADVTRKLESKMPKDWLRTSAGPARRPFPPPFMRGSPVGRGRAWGRGRGQRRGGGTA